MARISSIFQSVFIVVVFLAALACASGTDDDSATGSGGLSTGTGGTSGMTATGGTPVTGTDPVGTGGTPVVGTGGTPDDRGPVCGNNIKEEGEICDGTDLAGATCDTLASGHIGNLACAADCLNYDTTMCYPPPEADSGAQADGSDSYGGN